MTQEEIEWYEDNWHKGSCRFNANRTQATNSRSYKLGLDIWDWPYSGSMNPRMYADFHCWKSKRKTQYKILKVHKEKKRKAPEKEYWRYKKSYHTWRWYGTACQKLLKEKREARKREDERQQAHIAELKKVGHWIYKWKYDYSWYPQESKFLYSKVDLNDPFAEKHTFNPETA